MFELILTAGFSEPQQPAAVGVDSVRRVRTPAASGTSEKERET